MALILTIASVFAPSQGANQTSLPKFPQAPISSFVPTVLPTLIAPFLRSMMQSSAPIDKALVDWSPYNPPAFELPFSLWNSLKNTFDCPDEMDRQMEMRRELQALNQSKAVAHQQLEKLREILISTTNAVPSHKPRSSCRDDDRDILVRRLEDYEKSTNASLRTEMEHEHELSNTYMALGSVLTSYGNLFQEHDEEMKQMKLDIALAVLTTENLSARLVIKETLIEAYLEELLDFHRQERVWKRNLQKMSDQVNHLNLSDWMSREHLRYVQSRQEKKDQAAKTQLANVEKMVSVAIGKNEILQRRIADYEVVSNVTQREREQLEDSASTNRDTLAERFSREKSRAALRRLRTKEQWMLRNELSQAQFLLNRSLVSRDAAHVNHKRLRVLVQRQKSNIFRLEERIWHLTRELIAAQESQKKTRKSYFPKLYDLLVYGVLTLLIFLAHERIFAENTIIHGSQTDLDRAENSSAVDEFDRIGDTIAETGEQSWVLLQE